MKLIRISKTSFSDLLRPTKCDICGNYPFLPCLDIFGHKVCIKHRKEGTISHCSFCGRFCLQKNSLMISDGVFCCPRCIGDIPKDNKELGQMAFSIRNYYKECGLGEIPRFWVNQVKYDQLLQREGRVCLAYAEKRVDCYDIYLYEGLSRTIYISTLAHEVLHLWLWDHNLDPEADIREGFCNLGSYMIMKQLKTEDSRFRMRMYERDTDILYGGGFRKMKAIYDKGGWQSVIAFLKNEKL